MLKLRIKMFTKNVPFGLVWYLFNSKNIFKSCALIYICLSLLHVWLKMLRGIDKVIDLVIVFQLEGVLPQDLPNPHATMFKALPSHPSTPLAIFSCVLS
jgi:hypothetical protein